MAQASFHPALSPDFVAEALGSVPPRVSKPFTTVTTDSRQVPEGSLFVALKGDKFDGHEFIAKAIEAGAKGILARRDFPIEPKPGVHIFRAEDSLQAFRQLGAKWRHQFSVPVIAIAGAHGKTTTKEILHAILQGKWPKVLKTHGSENGFIGIPMTLLKLRPEHGAAVVEVGIDEIGAMQSHMAIVTPTAAVISAIGPEHLEKLRDVPTVAREEGFALSTVAQSGGQLAINLDDPWIRPHFSTLRGGRKLGYSLAGGATGADTLRGTLDPTGATLTVNGAGLNNENFTLPLPGTHNAQNLLAAITVALGQGLTPSEIREGLKTFQGAEGRSQVREVAPQTPVLCDYYNANPASTAAALELLDQLATQRSRTHQRWACLADMLELGPDEEKYHRELAGPIIERAVHHVLLYGPRMKWLLDELTKRGFAGEAKHFESHAELASRLTSGLSEGDAALIKGSRGMKMEEVWKLLATKFGKTT